MNYTSILKGNQPIHLKLQNNPFKIFYVIHTVLSTRKNLYVFMKLFIQFLIHNIKCLLVLLKLCNLFSFTMFNVLYLSVWVVVYSDNISVPWPISPSCRPLSPGEGSRWDTCLCPCPFCPWWFCTSLWPPVVRVAEKTLQGHLHRWQAHWLVESVLTLPPVGEKQPTQGKTPHEMLDRWVMQ